MHSYYTYKVTIFDLKEFKMNSSQNLNKSTNRDYKFNIGDTIKNITIADYTRHNNQRAYYGTCCVCHSYDVYDEKALITCKVPCHVCNGKKVKSGFNDIATLSPWMVEFLVNKDDAKLYMPNSNQKVETMCPLCGVKKEMYLCHLHEKGRVTCKCTQNMSSPEIFMTNVLDQLGITYNYNATHLVLPWAERFRFDFYFIFNEESYIIETHGMQHYRENAHWRVSLKSQKDSDRRKQLLAEKYIDHYIILDCRYSRLSYLKNAVLNSQLPHLLHFDEESINWELCFNNINLKSKKSPNNKHVRDNKLKNDLEVYLKNKDHTQYRFLTDKFKVGYIRLKRLINELIDEDKVSPTIVSRRRTKRAEISA